MTRDEKEQAVEILRRRYLEQRSEVDGIDVRLAEYFEGMWREPELHGGWEVLCAVKFLRLLRTYDFNRKKVRQVIRLREGEWEETGGGPSRNGGRMWKYVGGGLACPGTSRPQVYRWEPFQVFVLASVFGFRTWIDTQLTTADRQSLLPTECVVDGRILDLRRLCTDFTFYAPRKTDKTGLSAFIQVVFFLLEDANAEIYCTANSSDQSKILFGRTLQLLRQLDDGHRLRMTQTVADWRPQFQSVRQTQIRPLSAGGKTKDGMFAQLCCADEYGSAGYINGRSDMKMLVDVVTSSMGPRREPLVFTTTTAGRVTTGPFIEKLESLHALLMKELEWDRDASGTSISYDRMLCVCFEPDDWEKTDEELLLSDKKIRSKINPMLGKIVQHQFYDDAVAKARMEGDLGEVISKLFNVYQSATVHEWIKAEQVRPLQTSMRIDDCKGDDGWVVFTGLDFSQGDDLHTASYLAARKHPSGRGTEFFADFDCWVKEDTAERSSIRPLYESWREGGWLHYSPGKVFQPSLFIQRLDELLKKGVRFLFFGYDKYQSKDPINALKAYLQSTMGVQNPDPYIQVVSQLNSEFNAPTDNLYATMFATVPFISFSANPMWPWLFGNCVLEIDGRDNKRPVKRSGSDSCKIDPVQALIMAMDLYERYEGSNRVIDN